MPSNTTLRADLLLLGRQHANQIEVASLDQRGRQMRVHEKQLLCRQACQPPTERGAVVDELARAFLESDEYSGRSLPMHRIHQALQREHGLARAGAADDQARAVAREATLAQLIETLDAGAQFRQRLSGFACGWDVGPLSRGSPSAASHGLRQIGRAHV